jgi:hypothetical protein
VPSFAALTRATRLCSFATLGTLSLLALALVAGGCEEPSARKVCAVPALVEGHGGHLPTGDPCSSICAKARSASCAAFDCENRCAIAYLEPACADELAALDECFAEHLTTCDFAREPCADQISKLRTCSGCDRCHLRSDDECGAVCSGLIDVYERWDLDYVDGCQAYCTCYVMGVEVGSTSQTCGASDGECGRGASCCEEAGWRF